MSIFIYMYTYTVYIFIYTVNTVDKCENIRKRHVRTPSAVVQIVLYPTLEMFDPGDLDK